MVSSSDSRSMATAADSGENWECAGERMAGIELEAAEALAGLAHSAKRERETPVWNESPAGDSEALAKEGIMEEKAVISSDKSRIQTSHNEWNTLSEMCGVVMKRMQVEQNVELPCPSPVCATNYASFSCSKSRPNLTEAQKEARRIRRVLANRESARQTIRRRKALYEELTRKAASLAQENENLKREKELAGKEYDSLKSTNECLNAQMAKIVETEVEETRVVDSKLTKAETSTTSSSNYSFLLYNQPPLTPFVSPPVVRSSNPLQFHGPQNTIVVPLEVAVPAIATPVLSDQEQENPLRFNSPVAPMYILPFPWSYPLPDHGSGSNFRPSFDLNDEPNGISVNTQCRASSSSITVAHLEKHRPLLPIKAKTSPPPTVGRTVNAFPDRKQDLTICLIEKQLDANATAEARRRRKELAKLKSLNFRQFSCAFEKRGFGP